MKKVVEAKELGNGAVEPRHETEEVCAACGYDLTEAELQAATCADCGADLNIKRSVAITIATLPPVFGEADL